MCAGQHCTQRDLADVSRANFTSSTRLVQMPGQAISSTWLRLQRLEYNFCVWVCLVKPTAAGLAVVAAAVSPSTAAAVQ